MDVGVGFMKDISEKSKLSYHRGIQNKEVLKYVHLNHGDPPTNAEQCRYHSSQIAQYSIPLTSTNPQTPSHTSNHPTHPCLCLCFGFFEQIIYTYPFLLTLCNTYTEDTSATSPIQNSPLSPQMRTYLTPITHLLNTTSHLHAPNLLALLPLHDPQLFPALPPLSQGLQLQVAVDTLEAALTAPVRVIIEHVALRGGGAEGAGVLGGS